MYTKWPERDQEVFVFVFKLAILSGLVHELSVNSAQELPCCVIICLLKKKLKSLISLLYKILLLFLGIG